MSRVYAIADPHLGHKNICKFRTQFSSVEEHDEFIVNNILATCGKRGTLYILGDAFFTEESLKYLRIMKANIGQVHLVLGNHCTHSPASQKLIRTMLAEDLIDNIHGLVKYKGIWLSHAPIHESELRGKFNVYGHSHTASIDDDRYLCVSCEQVDYKPVNFQAIKEKLNVG